MERIIYYDSKVIEEDSTSLSKLRTLFENSDYDYTKRQEMITYISEEELPNINVYLKRIPNNENWILDVYGKKEAIHKFINRLAKQKNHALLSFITNIKLEEDNYSDYNLRFSDIEIAIKEELENFRNLNIKENYGNGN